MKIIATEELTTKNESLSISILKFDQTDFSKLKNFVLKETEKLNDEFFITDDVDTALYEALNDDDGKVFGVSYNSTILALLAIDHSKQISEIFKKKMDVNLQLAEVGWALVKEEFRGLKIIDKLNYYVEDSIKKLEKADKLVTTVHPNNISGLTAFFNMGYHGVKIFNHYGSIRMILLKSISKSKSFDFNDILVSSNGNIEEQKHFFNSGYVCTEFDKNKSKLVFIKNQ